MHAPQPPRPSTAVVVALRVLFMALPVLSLGFLAWATMLRVACVTRARRDWFLFGVSLAVLVVACALIINDPTDDLSTPGGDLAAAMMLLSAFGSAGYLLYADVLRLQTPPAGHSPTATTVAYGYPPSVTPQSYAPAPAPYLPPQPAPYLPPQPAPYVPPQPAPAPYAPPPSAAFGTAPAPAPRPGPAPTPQPQRPAPARIDQVRAELDELSDFLRGQDQGKDRGTGGGR
ncbi:hypothetical protein ACFYNZ_18240 [Streptomyces kebangsaanensis]|uniref:Integral membrane protein n=1 Tax=Streptomyces kebangsaanensis TaxID=864058 RepID=A0ABW6KU63_9ACTN